jgi:acetyltransferase-like isoleucine patch superfamily enzyme
MTKIRNLTLKKLFRVIRLALFFMFNFHRYRRLEFKSLISRPLRIDGRRYISLMKNAEVCPYSWLVAFKLDGIEPELSIGEGSYIGDFNHIAAVRRVVIGRHVLTANGVYISDNTHSFEDITLPIMHQPVLFKAEVHIGDGSWIGENVCIIGARIGRNCVIGANSVVTEDIPDYSVAVGAPAKVIKRYDEMNRKWLRI